MQDLAPAPALAGLESCRTCGAPRSDRFCSRCGQPHRPGRLTLRRMLRDGIAAFLNVERGVAHTLLLAARRPDRLARDVVEGRTVPYVPPFTFLLLCISLTQIVSLQTGLAEEIMGGFLEEGTAEARSVGARFIVRWFVALTAGLVPLLALVSRAMVRPARYNYAEHLVFHAYAYGFAVLGFAVLMAVDEVVQPLLSKLAVLLVGLSGALILFVLYLRGTRRFFEVSGSRALLATLAFLVTGLFFLAAALRISQ